MILVFWNIMCSDWFNFSDIVHVKVGLIFHWLEQQCVWKTCSKHTYYLGIIIIYFFHFVLGYIGNICMLNGPKSSTNKDMQEAIASVLVACLVVGTGTGSFLSLPIVKALWLLVYWLFFYKNLITSTKYNKSKRLCLCLNTKLYHSPYCSLLTARNK